MTGYDDPIKLTIHYTGKRFDDHTVPVTLLEDLGTIQEMILEVASEIFKRKSGTKRVPKGFREGCSLRLESVSEGSAVIDMTVGNIHSQRHIVPSNESECVSEAIDRMLGFMRSEQSDFDDIFREHTRKMGSKLRDDEAMTFSSKNRSAVYNQKVRAELTAACSDYERYESYYGKITEVDSKLRSFKLSPVPDEDGKRVDIRIRDLDDMPPDLDTSNMMGRHMMISGRFDVRKDGTRKARSIESVQVLDPLDVNYRLMELSSMRDGWGEHGDEVAPKGELLCRLMDLYDELCGDMRLPYIYPTVDGNIQMEWDSDDLMEMEVDLESMRGTLYHGDCETGIDLNSEEGWNRLSELVGSDDRRRLHTSAPHREPEMGRGRQGDVPGVPDVPRKARVGVRREHDHPRGGVPQVRGGPRGLRCHRGDRRGGQEPGDGGGRGPRAVRRAHLARLPAMFRQPGEEAGQGAEGAGQPEGLALQAEGVTPGHPPEPASGPRSRPIGGPARATTHGCLRATQWQRLYPRAESGDSADRWPSLDMAAAS